MPQHKAVAISSTGSSSRQIAHAFSIESVSKNSIDASSSIITFFTYVDCYICALYYSSQIEIASSVSICVFSGSYICFSASASSFNLSNSNFAILFYSSYLESSNNINIKFFSFSISLAGVF